VIALKWDRGGVWGRSLFFVMGGACELMKRGGKGVVGGAFCLLLEVIVRDLRDEGRNRRRSSFVTGDH